MKLADIIQLFTFAVVPAFLISCYKYSKLSQELKQITYYIFLSIITEMVVLVYSRNHWENLSLLHFYTMAEFFILYRFFLISLKGFIPSRPIHGIAISFLVLSGLNSIFLQKLDQYNSNARGVSAFLILLGTLALFYRIISEMKVLRLGKYPLFWINAGLLVYFSSSFFLFIMSNYILHLNNTLNVYIWMVHAVLNVILYTMISIGLWIHNNNS
jgi:hypothetical protein